MKTRKNRTISLKGKFFIASAIFAVLFAAAAILIAAWSQHPDSGVLAAAAAVFGVWLAAYSIASSYLIYRRLIAPITEIDRFADRLVHGEYPPQANTATRQDDLPALTRSLNLLRDRLQNQNARLQSCLQREQDQLRHSALYSELRSRFLTTMLPELRLPFNAISGYLYLLNTYPASGHCAEWIVEIENRLHDCERMLENFIEIGRLTHTENADAAPAEIDTASFMREVSQLNGHFAKQRNVALVNRYSADAPKTIGSDRRLLDQLISILLHTALASTAPGGTVEFSCAGEPRHLVFKIRSSTNHPQLIQLPELFRTYHRSETAEIPAQNQKIVLGLLFVEAEAELVKGTLQVEYDDRGHVELALRLPVTELRPENKTAGIRFSDNSAADPEKSTPRYGREPASPRRMLLIDTDHEFLHILRSIFPETEISAVPSALALPEATELAAFDSVILNIAPNHGEELISAAEDFILLAEKMKLPVVVVQDDDSASLSRRLHWTGVGKRFSKPLEFKTFRRHLIDIGVRRI